MPFTVVADWLQQGRLLAEDRVRLAGNKKWHTFATVPAFAPYLPKEEPLQVQDEAEALEPVDLGLDWRRPQEEDDEDVDMIPLIDISLVLLIFFMMTASVSSGILSPIDTPSARHQLEAIVNDTYWVGLEVSSRGGKTDKSEGRVLPWYSLGKDRIELVQPTRNLEEVTAKLAQELQSEQGEVSIRLRADRTLSIEAVRDITLELQGLEKQINNQRDKSKGQLKFEILGEVSEPKDQ